MAGLLNSVTNIESGCLEFMAATLFLIVWERLKPNRNETINMA